MTQTPFTINWIAVFAASISSFIIGAIWFGPKTFYPTWIKAQGREVPTERVHMTAGETILMFGGTYVGQLVQAVALAFVLAQLHVWGPGMNWSVGAVVGFLFSVAFGAFASLSHRMFGQADHKVYRSLKVLLIEVGQDVIALTVAGAILGTWI